MKTLLRPIAAATVIAFALNQAAAQTSWNSTSDTTWSTAANWTAGSPAASPQQLAIYPGAVNLVRNLSLAGATGRVSVGLQFDNSPGNLGYTFSGTAGAVSGFFIRAGGTFNGGAGGIVNNDHNAQTFNVPIKLTSSTGIAGSAAAMTFNAAAGDLIFNGNNNAPATPWTINLNGATALTFDGSFNTVIGSSGPGQIVNTNVGTTSGLIKNGSGILTLGGTAANTFVGVNTINAGTVMASKADALGAGNALVMTGGTFNTGGLNQNLGTLDLEGAATLNLGSGAGAVSFANSSAVSWGNFTLSINNWTQGTDTLRFGTDNSGLTPTQLGHIVFADVAGSPTAQLDGSGFLAPVPEPSILALSFLGGFGALLAFRRRH